MSDSAISFEDWLTQADLPAARTTVEVRALLQAVFRFRQQQGADYYSRLLSHLLLHCDCGLKVAQIARLTGFGRATAARQQGLSSKELIQSIQRCLAGRPYGKLLPRYAGPVAQFLCGNPKATHYDTLDFLARTFGVRVSLQALHTFLNTYGLDRASRHAAANPTTEDAGAAPGPEPPALLLPPAPPAPPAPGRPIPLPPPAFLLMPQALRWLAVANGCFSDNCGTLQRGLLTSIFAPRRLEPHFPSRSDERHGFCLAHLLFVVYEEPGPYVGAPAKEVRLAETKTTLRDETEEEAVRTIICREAVPGPKKDRWHPLHTTSEAAELMEVLQPFRQRQHHEQSCRVGKYDLFLDAVPCGYDKEGPQPARPRWHRGPLQMMGWLAALLYNALADLALGLPEQWCHAQVETLRRLLISRPGQLYVTEEAAIVYFDWFPGQEMLVPLIDEVNEQQVRLSWLGNRRLALSLMPDALARAGPCRSILDN